MEFGIFSPWPTAGPRPEILVHPQTTPEYFPYLSAQHQPINSNEYTQPTITSGTLRMIGRYPSFYVSSPKQSFSNAVRAPQRPKKVSNRQTRPKKQKKAPPKSHLDLTFSSYRPEPEKDYNIPKRFVPHIPPLPTTSKNLDLTSSSSHQQVFDKVDQSHLLGAETHTNSVKTDESPMQKPRRSTNKELMPNPKANSGGKLKSRSSTRTNITKRFSTKHMHRMKGFLDDLESEATIATQGFGKTVPKRVRRYERKDTFNRDESMDQGHSGDTPSHADRQIVPRIADTTIEISSNWPPIDFTYNIPQSFNHQPPNSLFNSAAGQVLEGDVSRDDDSENSTLTMVEETQSPDADKDCSNSGDHEDCQQKPGAAQIIRPTDGIEGEFTRYGNRRRWNQYICGACKIHRPRTHYCINVKTPICNYCREHWMKYIHSCDRCDRMAELGASADARGCRARWPNFLPGKRGRKPRV
eukprot:TRINITY_DN5592_c0_g1_i2.p1 TRINITY_DN5592_c0_g1~~TRINITY_DN5592_c0_g1_i2.p1  ORF type:complete len:468 (+),score=41.71 TRINITY_DN5592_c0_g1_i2:44-1447(+)